MKKNDLLKAIGIMFLAVVLLSWFIPAGVYSNGSFTSSEAIAPIGIYNLLNAPIVAIASFVQFGLVFLAIGAFYGVLNKTEVYQNIVNNIVSKWEKNKKKLLAIIMINLILLSSVIGVSNLIFVLVPFFAAILLKLNYSKITTFAATIGSILVGGIGSIFGSEIWGYLRVYFGVSTTGILLVRIIFLLMVSILFILLVTKKEVKDNSKEEKNIPLFEDKKTKKSSLTLIILLAIAFVICVVGFYNWNYTFNVTLFDTLYQNITAIEVKGFPLVSSVLGDFSQVGYWNDLDLVIILFILSFIISWLYNVKINEMVEGMKNGVKQMLLPALYAVLSFTIFTILYNQGSNFVATIVNKFISGSENFSLLGTFGSVLVGSSAYSYFPILLSSFYSVFSLYDTAVVPIIAFLFQSLYGVVMLVAPTSILLLGGLSYFNISYKEWIKYIWKFALILLAIVLVIAFIVTI